MIKSFGCSFIFGSELSDDGYGGPYATPSQLTWPALVARELNQRYACYARPGSGNLQIAERVLTHAASNEQDTFVIGWTWIDRFDYVDSATDRWKTIMPIDTDAVAKTYYRDLHSELRDKFATLCTIKLVIDTLKQKQIPYVMTYMDSLMFDQQWHTTPAVTDLQEYIRPCMTTFEGSSFLEWSRDHGYPETAAWHPLEQAHEAAGKYMIKHFKEL